MATTTYVPIQSYTVSGNSTTSYTFSSIPQNYTDLVIVFNGTLSSADNNNIEFNNENQNQLYSVTRLYGNGSTVGTNRSTSQNSMQLGEMGTSQSTDIIQIFNYSSTSGYKTVISSGRNATGNVKNTVGLFRSTSATNTIKIFTGGGATYSAGSTFSLYGIEAVNTSTSTPKATGGTITTDMLYTYHTFTSGGTFTPSQDLTAEVLMVGGGGGSGDANAGGGGAGGVIYAPARSLTNGTGYAVTIGSGGGANSAGVASTFNNLSATGGGYSIGEGSNGTDGGSGGGGGGTGSGRTTPGSSTGTSGTGYTFFGNRGGIGFAGYNSGGGGGAGDVGRDALGEWNGAGAGNGGIGLATWSDWLTVVSQGHNVNGIRYIAGGGGGGANSGPYGTGGYGGGGNGKTDSYTGTQTPGTANTGGGAGGSGGVSSRNGTNGGSGLVIIRYLKA